MEKLKEFTEHISKKENQCKGLYWRGSVNSYMSNGILYSKKSLRLLKRKSCSGCEECGWVLDYLSEDIVMDPDIDYLDGIKHGLLYTYEVHSSKGYFDLYPEIDAIEFVEVKE